MKFDEINCLLHGADYNAEQWLNRPDILKEDIRLMKKAKINVVSMGIFSWSIYEPQEGEYHFKWLDEIIDTMYENGIYVILATPSGARPPWLAKKHPEVMRTDANRIRHLYGERENHCNSSIVYREKVHKIDSLLAERYANHPALLMWHISNEVYGECHCESCQINFRKWLKHKYGTIDNLNREYWSTFWSHGYTNFDEIESPAPHGETAMHALALDYKRFYSDLSIDFIKQEIDTVKAYNPDIPVTTNMFHFNCGIDYSKLAKIIDVISWDSYPHWHCDGDNGNDWDKAVMASFAFDFCRTLKNKPFMLMESTPSTANGFNVCKLKKPKMHLLSSMQSIACGSDTVQYFQWRKSRGGYEKFHGAVISHNGSENTRVFRDVCEVGERLSKLKELKNAETNSKVALIFDWENMRALDEQQNLRKTDSQYFEIILEHYEALVKNYVSVDIIDSKADFSKYALIICPMLYMFKNGISDKIREYIKNGGTFIMGFYSGLVNENDLAYECYPPYALNDVFGIRAEETDCLMDGEYNSFTYNNVNYSASFYCDLIHVDNAEVLASYEKDFYAGMPVVTKNTYGNGNCFYIACRTDKNFLHKFYNDVISECDIRKTTNTEYVDDVMVTERLSKNTRYVFYMNFSNFHREIDNINLEGYDVKIITD